MLDLGAHYLPMEARRPIVPMPVVRWEMKEPLPRYLRYREIARAPAMRPEAAIAEKVHGFIQHCELLSHRLGNGVTMPAWALTGPASLHAAAQSGDIWARGAVRFNGWADPHKLPF